MNEFTTVNKPISMLQYDKTLYILGAQNNEIQRINLDNDSVLGKIELETGGFSSGLKLIENTSMALVVDVKNNLYSLIDLSKGKLLKSYKLNIPIKSVVITNKVTLFN